MTDSVGAQKKEREQRVGKYNVSASALLKYKKVFVTKAVDFVILRSTVGSTGGERGQS